MAVISGVMADLIGGLLTGPCATEGNGGAVPESLVKIGLSSCGEGLSKVGLCIASSRLFSMSDRLEACGVGIWSALARAEIMTAAEGKRPEGFLARARIITAVSAGPIEGLSSTGEGGIAFNC